jgi:hypothetical protein
MIPRRWNSAGSQTAHFMVASWCYITTRLFSLRDALIRRQSFWPVRFPMAVAVGSIWVVATGFLALSRLVTIDH